MKNVSGLQNEEFIVLGMGFYFKPVGSSTTLFFDDVAFVSSKRELKQVCTYVRYVCTYMYWYLSYILQYLLVQYVVFVTPHVNTYSCGLPLLEDIHGMSFHIQHMIVT